MKISMCTFCCEINFEYNIFNDEYKNIVKEKDNIVYKINNINIIPSIGPLNNYHLLIVPTNHYTSISKLNEKELEDVFSCMDNIRKFNQKLNLGTIFFEHGSCTSTLNDSSCIEHAHLHALGTNEELLNKIINKIELRQIDANDLHKIKRSYLLYVDLNNEFWINDANNFVESQLIRKVFVQNTNENYNWNWREERRVDMVKEIIEIYRNMK